MTRKELIQLAREAGLDIPDDDPPYNLEFNLEELGVFANLVAEKQQSWIASLEQNARDADRMYKELEVELGAAQAQIAELKDFAIWMTGCSYDFTQHSYFIEQRDKLLKTQSDDSALREMLAKERERCAKRCEEIDVAAFGSDRPAPNDCADAIRAMGGES